MSNTSRVLVIEDDLDTRVLYGECLRQEGYEVNEAEDGQEACDLLSKDPIPGVILMDLSVPQLSGADFISKLRSMPGLKTVPVVVLSGWDNLPLRTEQVGAQGYLRKPCDVDDLLAVVKKYTSDSNGE